MICDEEKPCRESVKTTKKWDDLRELSYLSPKGARKTQAVTYFTGLLISALVYYTSWPILNIPDNYTTRSLFTFFSVAIWPPVMASVTGRMYLDVWTTCRMKAREKRRITTKQGGNS